MTQQSHLTPKVAAATAFVTADGRAQLEFGGDRHELQADSVDAARTQALERIAAFASEIGTPVTAHVSDASGQWRLLVHGNGYVEPATAPVTPIAPVATAEMPPLPSRRPRRRETAPEAAPMPAHVPAPAAPEPPASDEAPPMTFLNRNARPLPAQEGWRGFLGKVGLKMSPGPAELAKREDEEAVSQHWGGPRTIAVVNAKGGAGKTTTTALTSAVFARYGRGQVLAWDNNQTRGTLGWRTQQGNHDSTILDLLPRAAQLLESSSRSSDLSAYVHHQSRDGFDVLRSKPSALASDQRISADDVAALHAVASKYYRLVVMDSGNDETDPLWLEMIQRADQIVIATTTRDDHAEVGRLLLESLSNLSERGAQLARNAVAVVTHADKMDSQKKVDAVVEGYGRLVRASTSIPFDPSMVDGVLEYDALRPTTQRAWLRAAAHIARGL